MRKLLLFVVLACVLAVGAEAARRLVLRVAWDLEATGPIRLPVAGAVGTPYVHVYCDMSTEDRVYVIVTRTAQGQTVNAMSVVPRGCVDWPR